MSERDIAAEDLARAEAIFAEASVLLEVERVADALAAVRADERARCEAERDELRRLADEAAHEQGAAQRRTMQVQAERDEARDERDAMGAVVFDIRNTLKIAHDRMFSAERERNALRAEVERLRAGLREQIDATSLCCDALRAVRNLTRHQETDPGSVREVGVRVAKHVKAALIEAALAGGQDALEVDDD